MGKSKNIKLAIIGSRSLKDYDLIDKGIDFARIDRDKIKCIVSGGAAGVDRSAEYWSKNNAKLLKVFPAKWDDIKNKPEKEIRTRQDGGKYWVKAGFSRNQDIAEFADICIAIHDGESRGTLDCCDRFKKLGKPVYLYDLSDDGSEEILF